MGRLREALQSGHFVVTAEVGPPKGVDVTSVMEDSEALHGLVDAINVTDQQSAVMRLGSLAVCHLLAEKGIESVFQLTCRDRNRIALQSDLLSAYVMGVENVLCLTGDYVTLGDHPQAKAVFDLDSVSLLEGAGLLQQGRDLAGKELMGSPSFFLGATVSPGSNPLEPQLVKMERKIRAGAQFFQTQGVFEPDKFERFMGEASTMGVPVLAGIIFLKSAGMARFMNRNVAGVHVPAPLIQEMDEAKDKRQAAITIAARLIQELRPMCQGVHIMAIGWEKLIPEVLSASGLSAAVGG